MFINTLLFPQAIRTPDRIINLMTSHFERTSGFSANFVERNDNKILRGKIIYKKPDKFVMTYGSSGDNQEIYCNGETLWIYLPKIRVVSEQKLESSGAAIYTKSGVGRLTSQYNFDFYSERGLTPLNSFNDNELGVQGYSSKNYIGEDRRMTYHMLLTPKTASVDKTGFVKIHLWIAEDGMIIRILGISTTKVAVEYVFSAINYNEVYNDSIFDMVIPQGIQVLKNALVPK